jgi:hypothetical protein
MSSPLNQLADLCSCEVSVSINPHTANYETIEGYLEFQAEEIEPEILAKMIKRNRLVWVQAYPTTPIGFYVVYHYDIDEAIQQVLEAVRSKQ